MKILKYLFLFVFCNFNSFAQSSYWLHQVNYSTTSSSIGAGADSLGNVYTAGAYSPTYHDSSPRGVFISKYDPNGNLIWSDTSNASWDACCNAIAVD